MCKKADWDEPRIQSYITDAIEENSKLEYKGAEALQKTNGKKSEITKDISSMANASGGILIYGIAEFSDRSKTHLPERISSINRNEISREWLDQVISNINPPIKGCLIHPVNIGSDTMKFVYVVEIPQSTTAHQAKDGRYYRRRNTTTEILEHYEIVDIMNRGILPDVNVIFNPKPISTSFQQHNYYLQIKIINSEKLVQHYQLDFIFSYLIPFRYNGEESRIDKYGKNYEEHIIIRSGQVLFPKQTIVYDRDYKMLAYSVDESLYERYNSTAPIISWTLYADNMQPKTGQVEFKDLHNYSLQSNYL